MKQLGLTDARLMKCSKKTRKEQFLEDMHTIIPWQRMLAAVEPHYPKAVRGLLLKKGTVVDATLIAAPPSTKDK